MSGKTWWVSADELSDEQIAVAELPLDGRFVITGPPGSGKTNLLALRAKYLLGVPIENFVVLAFQQPLVRFLRLSGAVPDDKIQTAMGWLSQQLWELNGTRIDEPDFKKKREALCAALTEYLEERDMSGLVDTLLVDEIQDYSTAELRLFARMARNLFMVGDVRQQIYTTDTSRESLHHLDESFRIVELTRHHRIGPEICKLADRLAKPEFGHRSILAGCRYEGPKDSVERLRITPSSRTEAEEIIERCSSQLDAYPDELLGVLCPTRDVLAEIAPLLETAFPGRVTVQRAGDYSDFDFERPLVVSTVNGGKGLEYRCVHIPGSHRFYGQPKPREKVYTAVTRAKTSVAIYHSEKLMGFFEDALAGDRPPGANPKIGDML